MILALCGYKIDQAREDFLQLRKFPGFEALPAARNNRIFLTDGNAYFSRPGPRMVDSLEILAGVFHPDIFPEFAPNDSNSSRIVRAR